MQALPATPPGLACPLSRESAAARFQYPRPLVRSYALADLGQPGVPRLTADQRTSLQFFHDQTKSKTLRFAFVFGPENELNRFANDFYGRPTEFIIFDPGARSLCSPSAPGFTVLNFPRAEYDPGRTPYARTAPHGE